MKFDLQTSYAKQRSRLLNGMPNKFSSHLGFIFLILFSMLLATLDPVKIQGLKLLDWQRQWLASVDEAPHKIILIEVDQRSLDALQQQQGIGWPWPREFYGGIADFVSTGGAHAVLIDILFNNETTYGPSVDESFAYWLEKANNVYLAGSLSSRMNTGTMNSLSGLPGIFNHSGNVPANALMKSISPPLPVLSNVASGVGAVNSKPDKDGTFRRISPVYVIQDQAIPLLSVAPFIGTSYRAVNGQPVKWENDRLMLGRFDIPLDEEQKMWIHYPNDEFIERYSAIDIIKSVIAVQAGEKPSIPASVFNQAYVLIGYVAPGLYDLKPTVFSARTAGVEIHAAILHSFLSDEFLTPVSYWQSLAVGIFFSALIYLVFLSERRISHDILLSIIVVLTIWAVTATLIHLDYIPFLPGFYLPAIIVALGIGTRRFIQESRDKEFRQKSLERMVSPSVARWLLEDPLGRMQRTGEMRKISIFFSDLAGFTTLAETLGPEKTVRVINQYMDMMQQVILQNDGTIKQFVGDAVMAIWGAPQQQAAQAELAIKTAIDSQQQLASYNFEYEDGQSMTLKMRIGIDHGECVVGNIGSSERFEYAAVGDTVNRAARLEGLNKYYGTQILVSESAWQAANGAFYGRQLDRVQVKGKNYSVGIYEPLAIAGQQTAEQCFIVDTYHQAWSAFSQQHWSEAHSLFAKILEKHDDPPSSAIMERIRDIEAGTYRLPDEWDGVWIFTTK